MTPAVLARDLQTRHGIYPSGTEVTVLGRRRNRWNVCLDPAGVHLSRRCHVVSVTPNWLTSLVDPPAERAPDADVIELLAECGSSTYLPRRVA